MGNSNRDCPFLNQTESVKEQYSLQKGIHETTEYLGAFLRNLLLNEKNELHNRNLHIRGLLNEEKVDIGDAKVDIENAKVDIERFRGFKTFFQFDAGRHY